MMSTNNNPRNSKRVFLREVASFILIGIIFGINGFEFDGYKVGLCCLATILANIALGILYYIIYQERSWK